MRRIFRALMPHGAETIVTRIREAISSKRTTNT
jgi:hypothetical protein